MQETLAQPLQCQATQVVEHLPHDLMLNSSPGDVPSVLLLPIKMGDASPRPSMDLE
jgi:hypothetical protein